MVAIFLLALRVVFWTSRTGEGAVWSLSYPDRVNNPSLKSPELQSVVICELIDEIE